MTYLCLKGRMSAESVLLFYIYLAAGPIYTYKGSPGDHCHHLRCAGLPSFVAQKAPVSMYSNMFLYSFTSLS